MFVQPVKSWTTEESFVFNVKLTSHCDIGLTLMYQVYVAASKAAFCV